MAKPGLTNITTSNTFENWLIATNDLIDIAKTNAITASSVGDTTYGNAILTSNNGDGTGRFTANNVIAIDDLNTNTIKPRTGSNINISQSSLTVTASSINTMINSSTLGPKNIFTNGTIEWRVGFSNSTGSAFIIDTGTGTEKFILSSAGILTVPTLNVTSIAATSISGTLTGNASSASTSTKLTTARTIGMTGDVTWTTSTGFDGTATVTGTSTIGLNKILDSMIRTSAATSLIGRSTNSTGNVADIAASANGQVLRRSGNILGFGAIDLSDTTNAVTNTLPVSNGGTGATSLTLNKVLLGSGTNAITAQSNLTWDSANNRLGINQAIPTVALQVTGEILASGNISAFSDEKLKTDIRTIDSALEKVCALRGVYFTKDGKSNIGVVAQEVEKIIPEVVDLFGDYKAVAYGNIVGLLIQSIKELTAKVEKLENNI